MIFRACRIAVDIGGLMLLAGLGFYS